MSNQIRLSELNNDQNKELLDHLMAGNNRWVQDESNLGSRQSNREDLISKQDPKIAVISCADSRVVPEYIFDLNLGELFVIRIAGNIMTPETIGSIEFAIDILEATLVLVIGHQNCGAVTAALNEQNTSLSPNLKAITDIVDINSELSLKDNIVDNIENQIKHLKQNSAPVLTAYDKKQIDIIGMFYSLESGKIGITHGLQG